MELFSLDKKRSLVTHPHHRPRTADHQSTQGNVEVVNPTTNNNYGKVDLDEDEDDENDFEDNKNNNNPIATVPNNNPPPSLPTIGDKEQNKVDDFINDKRIEDEWVDVEENQIGEEEGEKGEGEGEGEGEREREEEVPTTGIDQIYICCVDTILYRANQVIRNDLIINNYDLHYSSSLSRIHNARNNL